MMCDMGLNEYVFELDNALHNDILSCMMKVNMEGRALQAEIEYRVASRLSDAHRFFRQKL
jgi:hypothetical protein